jgi:hypothetical protein
VQRFEFAFEDRYRSFLRLIGVHPGNTEVVLTDDGRFVAQYGRMRVVTPRSNIAGTQITGPYRGWKAIGARASFADRGATFGTTTERGLCVRFHQPVRALFGSVVRHPGLTVTVRDCEALQAALEADAGLDAASATGEG